MEEKMNYEFSSCGDSVFSGFGSSSGLNTPAGSDLDSTESEEDDFMAELTRQMAENMLSEDDDDKSPPPYSVSDTTAEYYQHQKKPHNHHQQKNRDYGYGGRPGFVSGAQAGPGMRVVFLGGIGWKNGSAGTGVFLPANTTNDNIPADNQHQYCKKTVCSTVLIPERVLQTLQQHFEKRTALPNSASNGPLEMHTKWNQRLQSQHISKNNQEFQLPQEWTY